MASLPADIRRSARAAKLDPLAYMLGVMNDESATKERRDRMAIASAPFVHPRAADKRPGKKDLEQQAALAVTDPDFMPAFELALKAPH